MRRFWARLCNLFDGGRAERELAREVESHLDLLQESYERRGLSPEEAKAAARREYGGIEQAKELHREARGFPWIEQLIKDLRYGNHCAGAWHRRQCCDFQRCKRGPSQSAGI